MAKQRKLPTQRRQYHSIFELDKGLDYSKPTTGISEAHTPNCEEVLFRYKIVEKAKGTTIFADTDAHPLVSTIMHIDQYYKTTGADKLMIHTLSDVLYYDSVANTFTSVIAVPWVNLVSRITALVYGTSNLTSTVTVAPIVKNLRCRVIVWALHTNLICRVTVATIAASSNLVCRVTATNIPATTNLVCRVTPSTIVRDLVCRVNVLSL